MPGGRMGAGHVEEHHALGHEGDEPAQDRLGLLDAGGEERADLPALMAGADHAIAFHLSVPAQRQPVMAEPGRQESLPLCREQAVALLEAADLRGIRRGELGSAWSSWA